MKRLFTISHRRNISNFLKKALINTNHSLVLIAPMLYRWEERRLLMLTNHFYRWWQTAYSAQCTCCGRLEQRCNRNLQLADKYWPAVVSNGGKQITTDDEKSFWTIRDPDGVTLQGYDAVSYQTDNKAVKGESQNFSARYNGATYWFVSDAHAATLSKIILLNTHRNMVRSAVMLWVCGKLRPVDPTIFQFVDGRLILQHTKDAFNQFNKDVAGNTAKADGYWPIEIKNMLVKSKVWYASKNLLQKLQAVTNKN